MRVRPRLPASPDPRRELLALHRRLFRRQQQLIDASERGLPADFARYDRGYRRRVRDYERVATYGELLRAVDAAEVVYVGDYHTLKQAQRAFVKLAQHVAARGRPLVLGLEFVQGRYQDALDAYLAGKIEEPEFLEGIHYAEHQLFDIWPNFRPIFELARRLHIPCVALDHQDFRADGLRRRDEYAAGRLLQALGRPEQPRALVLMGQLHVAPPHLPDRVEQLARAQGLPVPRALVVYQNCEEVYWRLADAGLEQRVEVVLVRPGEFCLVNTSPIVCQRSYLDFLEGDFEGEVVEPGSPDERFKEMARMIAAFLGLDADEALEGVEVFAAGDLSFLEALRRRGTYSARELSLIKRQVLSRESYYLPTAHVVYLANLSVNHAAEEATHVVRHFCVGEAALETRSLVDSFYTRCLEETLGFFGSKVVNDRRKCAHEPQWRARLAGGDPLQRRIAESVVAHLEFERGERGRVSRLYNETSTEIFHAVTRALGYILGDKLYYALLERTVAKREVRELFLDPLDEEGAALQSYLHLSRKVGSTAIPPRH